MCNPKSFNFENVSARQSLALFMITNTFNELTVQFVFFSVETRINDFI